MKTRTLQRLTALCRKLQDRGGVLQASDVPPTIAQQAVNHGLVVRGTKGKETILATTEAGYLLSCSTTEAEALDALEVPFLLGAESVLWSAKR